jgi:ABC-2 type transport system ATP-binding protein
LDEPTIGLDVISQVRIREFLRDYNVRTGITVLLTSHYMADIQALCKRVLVINEGRAVFDGALRDLINAVANRRAIRLTLQREATAEELDRAKSIDPQMEVEGYQLTVAVPREQVPEHVRSLLAALPVEDLAVEDVGVETVIRDLFTNSRTTDKDDNDVNTPDNYSDDTQNSRQQSATASVS